MQFTVVAVALASVIFVNGQPSSATPSVTPGSCKTFPGDQAWPSKPDWDAFNTTVGGRLIATVPLGTPCHGSAFNDATCESLRSEWQTEQIQYVRLHIAYITGLTSHQLRLVFFSDGSFLREPVLRCIHTSGPPL